MEFKRTRTIAVTAVAGAVLSLGALATPASAADAYNPQGTVSGCELQGGCPAEAVSISPAAQGAVDWLRARVGAEEYSGYCLRLVVDAFAQGGGVDIGTAPTAVDYWNAHPDLQHPGDTNPPAGALVFWNATPSNDAGHVGVAEGGDTVISSEERSTTSIHEFSIAERNAAGYPYLGWMVVA